MILINSLICFFSLFLRLCESHNLFIRFTSLFVRILSHVSILGSDISAVCGVLLLGYREAVGALAWDPIVESRARLGGEVGEKEEEEEGVHLHVITIACVWPYITGCKRPWLETDVEFTVRRDIRRKKQACWISDKSVLGLDQDLHKQDTS